MNESSIPQCVNKSLYNQCKCVKTKSIENEVCINCETRFYSEFINLENTDNDDISEVVIPRLEDLKSIFDCYDNTEINNFFREFKDKINHFTDNFRPVLQDLYQLLSIFNYRLNYEYVKMFNPGIVLASDFEDYWQLSACSIFILLKSLSEDSIITIHKSWYRLFDKIHKVRGEIVNSDYRHEPIYIDHNSLTSQFDITMFNISSSLVNLINNSYENIFYSHIVKYKYFQSVLNHQGLCEILGNNYNNFQLILRLFIMPFISDRSENIRIQSVYYPFSNNFINMDYKDVKICKSVCIQCNHKNDFKLNRQTEHNHIECDNCLHIYCTQCTDKLLICLKNRYIDNIEIYCPFCSTYHKYEDLSIEKNIARCLTCFKLFDIYYPFERDLYFESVDIENLSIPESEHLNSIITDSFDKNIERLPFDLCYYDESFEDIDYPRKIRYILNHTDRRFYFINKSKNIFIYEIDNILNNIRLETNDVLKSYERYVIKIRSIEYLINIITRIAFTNGGFKFEDYKYELFEYIDKIQIKLKMDKIEKYQFNKFIEEHFFE